MRALSWSFLFLFNKDTEASVHACIEKMGVMSACAPFQKSCLYPCKLDLKKTHSFSSIAKAWRAKRRRKGERGQEGGSRIKEERGIKKGVG